MTRIHILSDSSQALCCLPENWSDSLVDVDHKGEAVQLANQHSIIIQLQLDKFLSCQAIITICDATSYNYT
jgi:hypothetical protein